MELDFINAHPEKPVIISRNWPGLQYEDIKREDGSHIGKADYNKLMVEEMTSFYNDANHGQNFYIIGSTPRSSSVMFECLAKADLPINKLINIFDCSNTRQRVNTAADEALKNFAGKYAKVKFIDTYPFLCNHTECTLIKDGIPIYTDTSHLSITGAEIVGKGVFNEIRRDTNLHK
ncbi:SGNH hydrolase domain-containing protein [Arsenophonus sp. aPb]|uniref:SGNH hydrolase domain-containing protein n=1 Tax=Arsenophonus sp. aPb TaxID=3041619 RepID=UPI00246966D1|nr:SGNH hydrolase domain-containing protein [Arsenophonus sp. aPb]WGL97128.1 SGNH hydrolase domain-containing protein [Arsenophonus sp. aPb]